MPDSPPGILPIIFQLYLLLLLIASIVCTAIDFSRDGKIRVGALSVWPTSWTDFLYFLWLIFVAYLGANMIAPGLARLISVPDAPDYLSWFAAVMGLTTHGLFILILAYYRAKAPIENRFALNVTSGPWYHSVGKGIFYYLAALPLIVAGSLLWHGAFLFWEMMGIKPEAPIQEISSLIASTDKIFPLVFLVVLAVVIAPISEEWLFRANIYRFLKGKFPPVIAMAVSSLLFALLHFNLKAFLPLFIVGVLLCRTYEKCGRILSPMIFHACFNANNTMVLLFFPNMEQEMGALLPFQWLHFVLS